MSSDPSGSRRVSSAHVLSMIAIVLALGGGTFAIAALKKNSVGKKQLKKNAVVTKKIKDDAVTGPKLGPAAVTAEVLQDGAVSTAKLADGAVSAPKIAPDEPPHVVGTSGEPQFGNGGDVDCLWSSEQLPSGIRVGPFSFYRSSNGRVYFSGTVKSANSSGGDGVCDNSSSAEAVEDGRVFTLPPGYRPDEPVFLFAQGGAGIVQLFIGGDEDTTIAGGTLAAGAVTVAPVTVDLITLEGLSFRSSGA